MSTKKNKGILLKAWLDYLWTMLLLNVYQPLRQRVNPTSILLSKFHPNNNFYLFYGIFYSKPNGDSLLKLEHNRFFLLDKHFKRSLRKWKEIFMSHFSPLESWGDSGGREQNKIHLKVKMFFLFSRGRGMVVL